MRVVYDTNVVLSATLYGGKPLDVLTLGTLGGVTAVTSPALLKEYAEILSRKFHVTAHDVHAFITQYERACTMVVPMHIIDVLHDSADNRVLECAVEGMCDYIVTGDKALLALGVYENVRIVTVNDFLARIES